MGYLGLRVRSNAAVATDGEETELNVKISTSASPTMAVVTRALLVPTLMDLSCVSAILDTREMGQYDKNMSLIS